jgi:hypothetical protein
MARNYWWQWKARRCDVGPCAAQCGRDIEVGQLVAQYHRLVGWSPAELRHIACRNEQASPEHEELIAA